MVVALSPAVAGLLDRARSAFRGGTGLLEAITWPRSVETAFFAGDAQRVPEPVYEVDRDGARERLKQLDELERELSGDDALIRLLRSRIDSYRLGGRMLLALGTKEFGELSRAAYGSGRTTWFDGDTTNVDFAEHLAKRLGRGRTLADDEDAPKRFDALWLTQYIRERLDKRRDSPKLEVILDDELSAKAIAGKKRLRIRTDATFELEEARSLYLHEVETHIFTAQNGDVHEHLDFLDAGGPLATSTQEGLAVFAELYAQALTLDRLRRLVDRVRLVAMAEDGAGFVELYRYLVDRGVEARSAYLDAARVCRGGLTTGGAPFTKDACYLAGLVEVYDFLRLAVTHDGRLLAEVLVSGRLALDEIKPLVALREDGLLSPPRFVPSWLRRWDDLLAHFAFTSFLAEIDLAHVARRHAWLQTWQVSPDEPT